MFVEDKMKTFNDIRGQVCEVADKNFTVQSSKQTCVQFPWKRC